MADTIIEKRKQQIIDLCTRAQATFLGKRHSFVYDVIIDDNFSKESIEHIALNIVESLDNQESPKKDIMVHFLETALCYLFSECNEEDQCITSLYKIASLFSTQLDEAFSTSTFGWMITNAKERKHHNQIDKAAFTCLIEKAEQLKVLMDNISPESNITLNIDECLDAYIIKHNLSCLSNDELYKNTVRKLEHLIFITGIQIDTLQKTEVIE